MWEIFATFGIDWRLLLINAINFGVLMLALWYFLYGPLMRLLEERRQKVERGVQDAEAAKRALEEIQGSRHAALAEAGKEAEQLLAAARDAGKVKERELVATGEAAAALLVKEAQLRAEELKREALADSKQEVAKLIVLGIEKMYKAP